MAATGFEKDIDLPGPRPRTHGRLLDVAREIPREELDYNGIDRLPAGVTWLPWGDVHLTTAEVNCNAVYSKVVRDTPAVVFQPAFLVYDALECSVLAGMRDELWARLDRNFEVGISAALATQLETGLFGGVGLVGDATYGPHYVTGATAIGVQLAMAKLEDYLAAHLLDGTGVIHLTPGLYLLAAANWMFDRDTHLTATGNLVIGDAGHTGRATPRGGTPPGTGEAYIYATGDVWYGLLGQDKELDAESGNGYVLLQRNKDRPLSELYGLVCFDPNILGAALVSYSASV